MDGQGLTAVVEAGKQLFVAKLLMVSLQCLWVYDYFMTLGDEVNYAWSGQRSWAFALFIANRYAPVVNVVWVYIIMIHYTESLCVSTSLLCKDTNWLPVVYSTSVTILAQITIAIRVYAMTGWNKLIGGTLSLVIVARFCHGVYAIFWMSSHAMELIQIDLDVFKVCGYKLWKIGAPIYFSLTIFFDLLAFLVILITARRSTRARYPGVPSIWDVIVRDSTQYFLLIFFVHLWAQLFQFLAPEGIRLLPGTVNLILVPMMASRLMLSLKKAAIQPKQPWSLGTMSTMGVRGSLESGASYSTRRMHRGLHETSQTPSVRDGEDVELTP